MLAGDTRDAGVNLEVAFLRPCLASGAQSSEQVRAGGARRTTVRAGTAGAGRGAAVLTGFDSQLGKGKARTARAEARGHGAVIRALRVLRGQNVVEVGCRREWEGLVQASGQRLGYARSRRWSVS